MDSKTGEKELTKGIVAPYDIDNVKNMTRAESGLLWPLLICGVSELLFEFQSPGAQIPTKAANF